jgi:thioredoxin-like negative regulator of GroEL
MNRLAEAAEFFRSIITGRQREYREDAQFYLAMTYIRLKDYPNASAILHTIQSDPQHLYFRQVSKKTLRDLYWLEWKR